MADNTTTIEVTDDQKGVLDDLKEHEKEPYKSVIDRLIDSYEGGSDAGIPSAEDVSIPSSVDGASGLDYDDVKNACASAVREELEGRR